MQIGCFSVSMYDEFQDKLRALQKYVKSLPITNFDGADRAQMSVLIASKYPFPEMPAFAASDIQRDEPEFLQGRTEASVAVY